MSPYLVGLGVSFALSAWLSSSRSLLRILDTPNERSLHDRPIPCTGGLAILCGIAIGWMMLWDRDVWVSESAGLWVCAAAILIAIVSFFDDIKSMPILLRLGAHGLAAGMIVWGMSPGLGVLGTIMVLFSIIWMLNLFNFMDGMDGFSAGMTSSGFCFLGLAGWFHEDMAYAQYAWVVAASGFGFLFLNFPPARIFMGDVGSTVLGIFAAAFSLWGIRDGVFPPWFPLLVFSPFIVDASVTLVRRILRGEKFWQAHRSHYYQRLAHQLGWGHKKTVAAEYVLMLAVGITALMLLSYPLFVIAGLVIWCALYFLLACAVDKRCAR